MHDMHAERHVCCVQCRVRQRHVCCVQCRVRQRYVCCVQCRVRQRHVCCVQCRVRQRHVCCVQCRVRQRHVCCVQCSTGCVVYSAALAVPFLLLGSEIWTPRKLIKKITSIEMVFLRNNSHGPRKEWRDLEELKAEPVDETLSRYNWNWLRHVTRMHSSRMAKITLNTVYTIRQTHAHMWKEFITWYSLPTCFDRRRGHLQGNLQDYREFKQTVKMRKWPTDCYAGYLKLPT